MRLLSLRCISDSAPHSAFTDLVFYADQYWCVFREGASHALCEGSIKLMRSADLAHWQEAATFSLPGQDLRDPHLAARPDGSLELICGRTGLKDGAYTDRGSLEAIYNKGSWGELTAIGQTGDWLWRSHWQGPRAWSISYRLPEKRRWSIHLMSRSLQTPWRELVELPIKGLPNEATIREFSNGKFYLLLRREAPGHRGRALLGSGSLLPQKTDGPRIQWQRLPWRIGGPNLIEIPEKGLAIAGFRLIRRDSAGRLTGRCLLAQAKIDSKGRLGTLKLSIELPSSGDCSYPGLVWQGDELAVSWYSSHEGKSKIYVASLKL